jgi:predicted NUDIX family phosphoesterase
MNTKATGTLKGLKRVNPSEINKDFSELVLLFPDNAEIEYLSDNTIKTSGLGEKLDKKQKDLLQMIEIINPLELEYKKKNVLMPRTYAESLSPIPQHISVQAIILSKIKEKDIESIVDLIQKTDYGRTDYDKIWIEDTNPADVIKEDSILYLMNRRIGGWDGSYERPVIELLGAGGHLPTLFEGNSFVSSIPKQSIERELKEEIGATIKESDIDLVGGFHNKVSNELVMLCIIYVDSSEIVNIQKKSLNNVQEDTDGIYIGRFEEVMDMYLQNASSFAGGEAAKASNFPNQKELMNRVYTYLR